MSGGQKIKPSGLAWAPEVPAHWTVKKLGFVAALQSGETITAEEIEETGPHPVYGGNGLRGYADRFTHRGHYALIGRQGALCGNINYAQGDFWASEHAIVATPREQFNVIWFGELLRAMNLNQYSVSAAQPGLSVDNIAALKIPVPPFPEQCAIADYLQRETSGIDALVTAKERWLELLAEKRQSLITHAVTRGINPKATLRDSGIPWLGQVPTHWQIERLKFHLKKVEQGWSPQCDSFPAEGDEWGVLKVGAVNGWEFNPKENKRLPDDVKPLVEYAICPGDVLMSRANTTELLGSTAIVRGLNQKLLLCDKLYRLIFAGSGLVPDFLVFFLRSTPGRFEFERDATGASNSMQNIGQDSVRNVWVPIPQTEEQTAIVAHIAMETAKLDALRAAAENSIALLKERRVALISAAVTGKLRVSAKSGVAEGSAKMV